MSETQQSAGDMVNSAIKAYRAGDKAIAKMLLETVVEKDPDNEKGWLWMSAVVDTEDEQKTCLENVLKANPENQAAIDGLAHLNKEQILPQNDPFGASVTEVALNDNDPFGASTVANLSSDASAFKSDDDKLDRPFGKVEFSSRTTKTNDLFGDDLFADSEFDADFDFADDDFGDFYDADGFDDFADDDDFGGFEDFDIGFEDFGDDEFDAPNRTRHNRDNNKRRNTIFGAFLQIQTSAWLMAGGLALLNLVVLGAIVLGANLASASFAPWLILILLLVLIFPVSLFAFIR